MGEEDAGKLARAHLCRICVGVDDVRSNSSETVADSIELISRSTHKRDRVRGPGNWQI